MPYNENKFHLFKLLSKKALIPSKNEIILNKNSRSAKLRYAVRNDNSFIYPKELENKFKNYFDLEKANL